ncbi:MAG: ribosome-associated translation inhibitor RaiA [Verrucomicrobiales bacterium]|nr:ribosome-associated translation inhibitor RaiA [Verrucomicrobiales bacterium]
MQTANIDPNIVVTGRHVSVTEPIREYAKKKVEGLHLEYPRIIEAKVVLDVHQSHGAPRHHAEIILFCANHITIDASSECEDLYAAIDETISKIARRMRKYKTRLLRTHRPRNTASIRHLDEHVFSSVNFEAEHAEEVEPALIHKENYRVRPLYPDEAITDLEISERSFVVFNNQKTHRLSILFRRKDGEYGMIEVTE